MDQVGWKLEDAIRSKNERRKELAALSYEEKVKIVIQLQRIAAPVLRARGKNAIVWEDDD